MPGLDVPGLSHRIPRRYRGFEERFVAGNRVLLLRDGEQAFPAMLEAIGGARRQILLEMYWFDSDTIGQRFARALSEAASRGVEVAVIYDALGSYEANPAMFSSMRQAGVQVIEYKPLIPWKKRFRLTRLSRRNHRKILVIDGDIGFTGGVNLSDRWLPESEGGQGWRDDMIRVHGAAVNGFIDCFLHTWQREDGPPLRQLPVARSGPSGDQNVRVLAENHHRNRRQIVSAYLHQIYRARQRVFITNAYFLPDPTVVRALKRAAARGVDVRVLLPGHSDVEVVRHASRAVYSTLLKQGVRIFEWHKSILHAKTAVIDGRWSTIGTFNLDYQSLRWNLEVNVGVWDEGFGAVMEASYLRDLAESTEVNLHDFMFRPLGDRLLERTLYRFRKFL